MGFQNFQTVRAREGRLPRRGGASRAVTRAPARVQMYCQTLFPVIRAVTRALARAQVYRYTVREALDIALCIAASSSVEEHTATPGLQQLFFNVRSPSTLTPELGAGISPDATRDSRHATQLATRESRPETGAVGPADLRAPVCLQVMGLADDTEARPVSLTNDIDLLTLWRAMSAGPDAF